MPVATVEGLEKVRKELKTLEGAYVVIRRATYGEYLKRQQMTSNMKISSDRKSDYAGVMELINKAAVEYEFANLIIEHNLQKKDGSPLNFSRPGDIDMLASNIGNEINSYINEMNAFEDADEGNSSSASNSQSEEEADQE